jgi:hypothetical protein
MKKEICNDLLEYNTFSSRSLTTKNLTNSKRKDLPSQVFQGGKQKYKVTSINEISKRDVKTEKFNDNKENKNDCNNQVKHNENKTEKLNKLDKLKEKFSKLEILKEEENCSKIKYNMDVMDYKNNYNTPRTEKRIEYLFSYKGNDEKRKTNFSETLTQIENKLSNFSLNNESKINETKDLKNYSTNKNLVLEIDEFAFGK